MHYDYLIGGVKIRIRSTVPIGAGERWKSFASAFDEPDHEYILAFSDTLPRLAVENEARGEFVHCALVDNRPFRTYLKSNGSAYATVFERSSQCWEISLLRGLLPWGSEVEHLFPLMGLSRVLLRHNRLLLHGAYVESAYGGILFTAPSGTGKTTQAELWRRHRDARIINGDRAVLSLADDSAVIHGFVHSGSSPDCLNMEFPLFAVIALSQGKDNQLLTLSGKDAIRALMRSAYLLPEFKEDLPLLMFMADKFCSRVPLLYLSCLPDVSAVEILDRMFHDIMNKSQKISAQSIYSTEGGRGVSL